MNEAFDIEMFTTKMIVKIRQEMSWEHLDSEDQWQVWMNLAEKTSDLANALSEQPWL